MIVDEHLYAELVDRYGEYFPVPMRAASIQKLDPRAMINVIAFGSEVRRWERGMVQANQSNKDRARGFVNSYQADGETNFYGALCAALDVDNEPFTSPNLSPVIKPLAQTKRKKPAII